MDVLTYKIQFPLKRREKRKIVFPFEMVAQTSSLSIEKYCQNKWPSFMNDAQRGLSELYELQKMKTYIKKTLAQNDLNDIMKFFSFKQWFSPLPDYKKFLVKIEIKDATCKLWDRKIPYLQLNGEFTIDIDKIVDEYIRNQYITIRKGKAGILKEAAEIRFMKSFPLLLTYEGFMVYNPELLDVFKDLCNKPGHIVSQIEKEIQLKDVATFRKELQWQSNDTIKVIINDLDKILIAKAKKHAIPIAVGAWLLNKHRQDEIKKQIIGTQIDIFDAMLNEIKKDYEKSGGQ